MIYLYGAGGHAKVIAEILEESNKAIGGIIDDDVSLFEFWEYKVHHAVPSSFNKAEDKVIVTIGNNHIRKKIVEKLNDIPFDIAIDSKNAVSKRTEIGEGTVIVGNTLINADTRIGKHCIINSSASIDHDCVIADFVHISPSATLCGNVTIGEGSHIGAGATIIPGINIGKNVIIGAGAVVIRNIPDNTVAVGNPAKPIKNI